MRQSNEIICDDNGIELLVSHEYEETESFYEEPGNPSTLVSPSVMTELKSVELVICGIGVDVLSQLTEKQKTFIINKLQYE